MSKIKAIFNKIDSVLKAHNISYDELIEEVKSRKKETGKRKTKEVKTVKTDKVVSLNNNQLIDELAEELTN